ncbi:NAD-dependent epimerase/dehydratase family protein [Silvanigrella sp.]|jgi:UDP-glucose 4-epimerase|uniref:NAD-dependent epimerase/dehydratase family protein n=1 Tax=Silvanigrella sp. TaxID=2024976 RepID=UPI0037C897D7|nr:SDR family oxidoreductase [Silvanigrellaceae bacterium]
MKKKILITGGLGYLGARIANNLSSLNTYDVYIGTRNSSLINNNKFTAKIIDMDFDSEPSLKKSCNEIDTIIHLAAPNEIDAARDYKKAINETCIYTVNLLAAAEQCNVKRIIYFSTAHIYGSPLNGYIDENTLPKPSHPYSICNKMSEDFILAAHANNNIIGIVLRLSNSFGYPVSVNINRWTLLVNNLCKEIIEKQCLTVKNPYQLRDFITISDVEKCILHFLNLEKNMTIDGLFNLGGKNTLSVIEIAKIIASRCNKILDFNPKIISPENLIKNESVLNYSISKLESTGFCLSGSIEDEIDNTLLFCRDHFKRVLI